MAAVFFNSGGDEVDRVLAKVLRLYRGELSLDKKGRDSLVRQREGDSFSWSARQKLAFAVPENFRCPKCHSQLFIERGWRVEWFCFCCGWTGPLKRAA